MSFVSRSVMQHGSESSMTHSPYHRDYKVVTVALCQTDFIAVDNDDGTVV